MSIAKAFLPTGRASGCHTNSNPKVFPSGFLFSAFKHFSRLKVKKPFSKHLRKFLLLLLKAFNMTIFRFAPWEMLQLKFFSVIITAEDIC